MLINQLVILAVTSFIVGFSGALMPGPVFVATVAQSARRGYVAGPLIVIGHAILESVLIADLCLGLSLVMGSAVARAAIGLLGGVFLLWTGCDLVKHARKASLGLTAEEGQAMLLERGPVFAGIVTSASNPYFYVWWATIGDGLALQGLEIAGLAGVVVFALSHWMSDLSWYTLVSASVHKGKRLMSDRLYKVVLTACGGSLRS